ncbi:MAG: hypothetical protein JSW53_04990 [Candidatus Bathyarchaeota archaeon]|nr:MAG: hypothetical protein JSW53_04990 [Candidatus Bathyarchaeota archaeon]
MSLFEDGQWHALEEIISRTAISELKINEILLFLADHNFIHFNNEYKELKITSSLRKFLEENQTI